MKFAAADGFDGTLQSFVTFPADFCYKLAPVSKMLGVAKSFQLTLTRTSLWRKVPW